MEGKHSSIRCETRVEQGDHEIHNCIGVVNVVRRDEVQVGKTWNGLPADECPICQAMGSYMIRGYVGESHTWEQVDREFRSWVTRVVNGRVVNGREVRYRDDRGGRYNRYRAYR